MSLLLGARRSLLGKGQFAVMSRILATRPGNLLAYWPLNNVAGSSFVADMAGRTGNVLENGGFEHWNGISSVFTTWTHTLAAGGAIVDETVDIHSGGHAAKITGGTTYWQTRLEYYKATSYFVPGVEYTLSFWAHGDGTHAPSYQIWDITHSANIVAETSTGVTGAVYQQITRTFTVPAGCVSMRISFMAPANGAIAYIDDVSCVPDASSNPMAASVQGATLGQPGVGDGLSCAYFDGVNDYIDLRPIFVNTINVSEGTALIWVRPDDPDWWRVPGDDHNETFWQIVSTVNNMLWSFKTDGEALTNFIMYTGTVSMDYNLWTKNHPGEPTPGWLAYAATWSNSDSNRYRAYETGSCSGPAPASPIGERTNLGTFTWDWTDTVARAWLGATPGGINYFQGWLAHVAFWDVALTQPEISAIS